MLSFLEWGWLLTTFAALTVASYFDVKNRIIPDKIWALQLGAGIVLDIIWFFQNNSFFDLISFLSSIILATVLFMIIIFSGAMGVGDAKAFFCMGISFPLSVFLGNPLLTYSGFLPPIIFIFIYFGVINLIVGLFLLCYNILQLLQGKDLFKGISGSKLQKIAIMIEGLKVDLYLLEQWDHYNVAERYEDNVWSLHTPRFEPQLTDEEFEILEKQEKEKAIADMEKTNKSSIWIRPQMPGIVYLLIGFVLFVSIGPIFGFIF